MAQKQAMLVVSFGTSHKDTRDRTIGAIEKQIAQSYPEWEVRRAFTSGIIMKLLEKRDRLHIDDVSEAMARLKDDGFQRVLVQPTHIINGDEYEKMIAQIEPYREYFQQVVIGRPLLTDSEDYERVCRGIMEQFPKLNSETALVLMGHGTGHFADAAYAALDYRFKALGYGNVFVGTVEGYPELVNVLDQVKRHGVRRVVLLPFMVVAGDHAANDMAGDEGSWKNAFEQAGYETECILKGIGEFEPIRRIYLEHIRDGLNE